MKIKDLKIGMLFNIGFAIILLLVILLGYVSYRQTSLVHQQTEALYVHPLQVRRAIGSLRADILSIQLDIMDIFILTDPQAIESSLAHIEGDKADGLASIQIIREQYLGSQADVDTLESAYFAWLSMAEQTLHLFQTGEISRDDARAMRAGVGGEKFETLFSALQTIDDFANAKGDALYVESQAQVKKLTVQLILITGAIFLLTVLIIHLLVRNIRNPILALTETTRRYNAGDLDARNTYASKNELGTLSASFNTMADKTCADMALLEERHRLLLEAQEQLVRQEKLAALGQLAGGVGHELRNPLGVINNSIYYLKMIQSEADENVRKYHGYIEEEVRKAEKIVNDLLGYARSTTLERTQVSIPELVQRLLERTPMPPSVQVTLDLPADLPCVFADPGQLEQVLGNLLVNACQAMPQGGHLSIAAEDLPAKAQVRIAVGDTGEGIAPEHMTRLFEPLFTTKARGIGLGLAISRKLAESNGGRIEVASQPGEGSVFTLFLPVVVPPEAA